jgi:hypothetical protein
MTTVPIKTFSDVILFELQKRNRRDVIDHVPKLAFTEIWKACEDAAPNLEEHKGRSKYQNMFVRDIYNAVEDLEEKKLIVVTRRRTGRYQRILQIDATPEGKLHLEAVLFTHQPKSCSTDEIDSHK